jgi:hypothetical protein
VEEESKIEVMMKKVDINQKPQQKLVKKKTTKKQI